MHTLSSARRTCMASASAVECTATVAMPSSLQARSTRKAISPRLAIRILSNIALLYDARGMGTASGGPSSSFDDHQRLAEFHRTAVLDQDLLDGAGARRRDVVHGLHRFDDQQGLARL